MHACSVIVQSVGLDDHLRAVQRPYRGDAVGHKRGLAGWLSGRRVYVVIESEQPLYAARECAADAH